MDANIDTPAPAAFGEKVTAPITLKAADGSALTADSISAADCTIATIALSADKKNIEVTAGSTAGRQVAKITVTSGSLSETVNVPITVYDNSAASKDTYEYRFYKAPGKSRVDQMMTTFAASTEGHRWELVTNRHSMPYKLVGAPATTLHYPHSYGTLMTGTGSFDMHIHVPARSTYDFYTLYAPAPTGAKITYTIRRADGTGETQTIGTHNTFGEGYAASEAKVGTVKLDKGGEYIVNFKIENGGGEAKIKKQHDSGKLTAPMTRPSTVPAGQPSSMAPMATGTVRSEA